MARKFQVLINRKEQEIYRVELSPLAGMAGEYRMTLTTHIPVGIQIPHGSCAKLFGLDKISYVEIRMKDPQGDIRSKAQYRVVSEEFDGYLLEQEPPSWGAESVEIRVSLQVTLISNEGDKSKPTRKNKRLREEEGPVA